MFNHTQCAADAKRRRAIEEAGHWELPLDGHGLPYFEEMEVEFRTLPPPLQASPLVQALTIAREAHASYETAKTVAEIANKAAAANPSDPTLQADAAAKDSEMKVAKGRRDDANKAAALVTQASDPKVESAAIIIELISKKARGGAIWRDILTFESALLRLLPLESLKTKLLGLRQEYKESMGAAAQAMEINFIDLKALAVADLPKVLAEAGNLLAELHWNYTTAPQQEWQKTRLALTLGSYTALVCAVILLVCWRSQCSTLTLVMLSGALGAALSAFQRIQSVRVRGAPLLSLRKAKWGSISIGVAPLLGALFALLLAFALAGNLIQGAVFPRVHLTTDAKWTNKVAILSTTNIINTNVSTTNSSGLIIVTNAPGITNSVSITNTTLLTNLVNITNTVVLTNALLATSDPATWQDYHMLCEHYWAFANGADLALLLVWAFIAGFSERLVPDLISRVAERTKDRGENVLKS